MIFVSFFTKNTGYEQEVQNLIRSLDEHQLRRVIYPIRSLGSWQANTQHKAVIIKQALSELDENIVYVDADAIVRRKPTLFDDIQADIGVHFRNGKELLGGTIFLRNRRNVRTLVDRWVSRNQRHQNTWDQQNLAEVIKQSLDLKLSIFDLPPSYTQIFDTMKHNGEPVIEHFQASRRFRKQVDFRT